MFLPLPLSAQQALGTVTRPKPKPPKRCASLNPRSCSRVEVLANSISGAALVSFPQSTMFKASQSVLRFGRALNAQSPSSALARSKPLALARNRQAPLQLARFASKSDDKDRKDPPPPPKPIDYEAEREIAQQKLESHPSKVSSDSSTTRAWDSKIPVMTSPGTSGETSLDAGLKHDLNIVKDTFNLANVPREANALGIAGTIPYVATSLSTVFLAWDLGKELPTGNALYDLVFVNHETAKYLIDLLQPIQLGYGAVIISFLGAIHWGMEFTEKKPDPKRTRFRYGMGLASSIMAWPTLFMPFEYALTAQWAAFVGLYFADSRAGRLGWAPRWYGVYRFLLTAIVGFAILVSLVGRAHMSQHGRLTEQGIESSLTKPGLADTKTDWVKLEKEEKEKIKKEKEEAERKAKKEEKEKKKQEKKAKSTEKTAEKESAKKETAEKEKGKNKGDEQAAQQKDESADEDKEQSKSDDKEVQQQGEEKSEDKGDEKSDEESDDKGDDKATDEDKSDEKTEEKADDKDGDKNEADKKNDKQDSQEKGSDDKGKEQGDDSDKKSEKKAKK
ncbi:Dynein heavy chain-like protein [Paramyrothecium foliicola]|nr:Dynein heavy chain-like protein [Paramyrothecium foliicola]